jgi:hypothetical protein
MNEITISEYKKLGKKKSNKYHAELSEYRGRIYDSTGEMEYAVELDWRRVAGEIAEIIPQYPIKIVVNGTDICKYLIDFKIVLASGEVEYHEYKGVETDLWKLKWKLVLALYPNWKFILIKK